MGEKKEQWKFTIQFNPSDPCHRQTSEILNQQGRRKAQFIANAVMHYLHCPEMPDIPQPLLPDTALIEAIIRRILAEQQPATEKVPLTQNNSASERTIHKSENIPFDRVSDTLGEKGMEAIAKSIANFRKK